MSDPARHRAPQYEAVGEHVPHRACALPAARVSDPTRRDARQGEIARWRVARRDRQLLRAGASDRPGASGRPGATHHRGPSDEQHIGWFGRTTGEGPITIIIRGDRTIEPITRTTGTIDHRTGAPGTDPAGGTLTLPVGICITAIGVTAAGVSALHFTKAIVRAITMSTSHPSPRSRLRNLPSIMGPRQM